MVICLPWSYRQETKSRVDASASVMAAGGEILLRLPFNKFPISGFLARISVFPVISALSFRFTAGGLVTAQHFRVKLHPANRHWLGRQSRNNRLRPEWIQLWNKN